MNRIQNNFLRILSLTILLFASVGVIADEATLYKAATVYTMDGKPLSPGQVLVVDGKIKAVGESVNVEGLDANVVDLGPESVLMPGLVDAYSQTAIGNDGSNESTDEVTADFRVINSVDWDKSDLRRQRELGTTTMCVCPGTQNVLAGISAIIKTLEHEDSVLTDDGPLLASMCADPAAQNRARARPDSVFVRQPTNRMGVVWILRNTFDKAKRSIEGSKSLNPVQQTINGDRPLMVVSRLSHDLTTVATLADEFGFSPIIVGGQEVYKVKEQIAARKYPVILQRVSVDTTRGAEGSEVVWNQAGVLSESGITFALSGNDLLDQARFAHRHGLDKNEALAAITAVPAKLLGLENKVGTIKVGCDADLIALDGDPLELTTSIRWVMVNGQSSQKDKE